MIDIPAWEKEQETLNEKYKALHDEQEKMRNVQFYLERAKKEAEKNNTKQKDQPFIS